MSLTESRQLADDAVQSARQRFRAAALDARVATALGAAVVTIAFFVGATGRRPLPVAAAAIVAATAIVMLAKRRLARREREMWVQQARAALLDAAAQTHSTVDATAARAGLVDVRELTEPADDDQVQKAH